MEKIIVALDGSERAARVLSVASEFARKHDAKLVAVRAVSLPVEFPIEAMAMTAGDSLAGKLIEIAQKSLDAQIASDAENLALYERPEVRIGTPWQVICDVAKERRAALIVIGTHGYTMIDRLIGTTAARVVNNAHCSVLVVRNDG